MYRVYNHAKTVSAAIGLSLCGYLLYRYLKKTKPIQCEAIIPVPREYVGLIIGRKGQVINKIRNLSGASVSIEQGETGIDDYTCTITGSEQAVTVASLHVTTIISEEEAAFYEYVTVPNHAIGSVIGAGGSTLQSVSDKTGANINIWNEIDEGTRFTLKASHRYQIENAKEEIQQIVKGCEDIMKSLGKRIPRKNSKYAIQECLQHVTGHPTPFEIYVSAMVDPSRFWIQVVGPKAQELDQLVEAMTEYYKVPENRNLHKLENIEEGDFVAATFQYDSRWYRAEVLTFDASGEIAELYYVDYGDTEKVPTSELYDLKVNYLQLHFQAIECFLSGIYPAGDTWSSEAIDRFEEWAYVAQWRKLSAKLTKYEWRERHRALGGKSTIPGIQLFDVVNATDINIADELVRQGYALKMPEVESSGRSSTGDYFTHVEQDHHDC